MNDAEIIAACRASADALLAFAERIPIEPTCPNEAQNWRRGIEHWRDEVWSTGYPFSATDFARQECAAIHRYACRLLNVRHLLIRDTPAGKHIRMRSLALINVAMWSLLPRIPPETDQRERDYLQAWIGTVQGLIDQCGPEDFLIRMNLEEYLAEMREEANRG